MTKEWDIDAWLELNKKKWAETGMDEFDKMLKMLHESTHDKGVREALLIVQNYKLQFLHRNEKD